MFPTNSIIKGRSAISNVYMLVECVIYSRHVAAVNQQIASRNTVSYTVIPWYLKIVQPIIKQKLRDSLWRHSWVMARAWCCSCMYQIRQKKLLMLFSQGPCRLTSMPSLRKTTVYHVQHILTALMVLMAMCLIKYIDLHTQLNSRTKRPSVVDRIEAASDNLTPLLQHCILLTTNVTPSPVT